MKVTRHTNVSSFLDRVLPLLERNEPLNGLLIGLTKRLEPQETPDPEKTMMMEISENGETCFAAIRSSRPKAVVYGEPGKWESFAPLVLPILRGFYPELGGFQGPRDQVLAIVEAHKIPHRIHYEQGLYRLNKVIPPRPAKGHARRATPEDGEILAKWFLAFAWEAMEEERTLEEVQRRTEQMIANQDFWVWDNGGPVAMTATLRPTRHGICISYVYTPPEERGNGYGTNLTAAVSQGMLDLAYHFCTLFTDMANPTSNSIYQKIGYRKIADFVSLVLTDHEG